MKSSFSGLPELDQSTTTTTLVEHQTKSTRASNCNQQYSKKRANMQDRIRIRVINKLALILLSIVVLELILIGDQVQPVKGIKKKIYLKKLKKLLPLLALVKPKKKIILLPIPIPMFKNSGYEHHMQPHQHGQAGPPMSFMMMPNEPNLPSDSSMGPMSMSMLPMSMSASDTNLDPFQMMSLDMLAPPRQNVRPTTQASVAPPPVTPSPPVDLQPRQPMAIPSMTMTIQSDPGGSSAIELSTNLMGSPAQNVSAPLQERPLQFGDKRLPSQIQHQENFDEPVEQVGGEQYYSSPWQNKWPLASPAKVFRNEQFRQQVSHSQQPTLASRPQRQQAQPMYAAKNQWRPAAPPTRLPARFSEPIVQQQQQQQLIDQTLEYEQLIPLGPPQMMPVYQTANGQLHLTPPTWEPAPKWRPAPRRPEPTRASSAEREESPGVGREADRNNELNSEVQTIGTPAPVISRDETRAPARGDAERTSARPAPQVSSNESAKKPAGNSTKAPSRLTSPAVKGKQQQQQQQLQLPSPSPKSTTATSSSY